MNIFRRSTRKAAQAAAVLATGMECSELEAASQAQHGAVQEEIDKLWQRLITNDSDVVLAVLSHAFQTSTANAVPLGVWDAEVQLALLAPDLAALPERHPTTTAAGNLSLKKFTKGEMADLYKQLVAGLALVAAKETFAVAPGVRRPQLTRTPGSRSQCPVVQPSPAAMNSLNDVRVVSAAALVSASALVHCTPVSAI